MSFHSKYIVRFFYQRKITDKNIASFKTQKVIADGILVQVNDMVISKGVPETVEKYKVCYFDENCDEEGILEDK